MRSACCVSTRRWRRCRPRPSCAGCWCTGWAPAKCGSGPSSASATAAAVIWHCCRRWAPNSASPRARSKRWTCMASASPAPASASCCRRAISPAPTTCSAAPTRSAGGWCAGASSAAGLPHRQPALPEDPGTVGHLRDLGARRSTSPGLRCPASVRGRRWRAWSRCWKPTCSISRATCTAATSTWSSSPSCATKRNSMIWRR